MAFTPAANDGLFDDANTVLIVPNPPTQISRMVKTITCFNSDDIAHTINLIYNNNGANRTLISQLVQPGGRLLIGGDAETYVLDSNVKYILGSLNEATALAEVTFVASWADLSSS